MRQLTLKQEAILEACAQYDGRSVDYEQTEVFDGTLRALEEADAEGKRLADDVRRRFPNI